MTTPILRAARPGEVAAIDRVIRRAYAADRARLEDLPDVTEGLAEEVARRTVIVADAGAGIAGVAICGSAAEGFRIFNVAVDPGSAGAGLGRALMAEAERLARENGHRVMQLTTHVGMDRTRAFYARMGWEETGITGNAVAMRKRL